MSKRHILEIRSGKELSYYTKIFEDGFNPSKEFYKDLKIDLSLINNKPCEFEVDFTQLLLSWWRVVVQTIDKANLAKYIEETLMIDGTASSNIEALYNTMICDYFCEYISLMDYTASFEPNRLDSKYKAYIIIS